MKLFLALPVYGGYHPHFVHSLLQLVTNPPCALSVHPQVGDSLVSRARNRLAAQFLASDCTQLLFLDTDLVFSPDHIARLISHDAPIVAGLYPKKQPVLEWVLNTLPANPPPREDGLQPVKYVGTGCLLIARAVLEKMRHHPACKSYTPDGSATEPSRLEHDFFPVGVRSDPLTGVQRYHSEDWYFCANAHDMKIPVYVDTHVALKHCGDAVYPLQDLEAEPPKSPPPLISLHPYVT